MIALKHIYSLKLEKEKNTNISESQTTQTPPDVPFKVAKTLEASLATAFTNATLLPNIELSRSNTVNSSGSSRTMGSIIRQPPKPAGPSSSSDMPSSFSKLDFSGVRLRQFLESGMTWGFELDEKTYLKDILGEDKDMLHLSIDYLLETDSSHSLEELLQSFNSVRLNYVSTFLAGLLHTPFSLLTYAAPVLSASSFKDLQESAWIALCDQDYEYADAAASFFLLCCVKERDCMYSFLKSKAKTNHPVAIRDAVTRFEILWRCRDGVWSRMEQTAPKHFKLDEETADSIGYSLPSQLLGVPGESLPHAPWKPASICTRDHSKESVQCYQRTKHAPLEHLHNVVKGSRLFPVSGSSIVQMEGDTMPAVVNSNALFEIDREEYEQGRLIVKDVYKLSTLFPTDLLPLITMVIKALEPPHSYTSVLLKADVDSNIPSITQISCMAEQLLWRCMLDNSYNLFYPLLNQFNVLYKVIKDNKRKPKLTVEDSAAELLEGIIRPFHILLSHFPQLPPKASHLLFNNFIGIVMRHTEQPVVMSDVIVHSVLTLLRMVVPSMKGLTMKELKNQLKKESCYTTVLTTARIRGVEMIKLTYGDQSDATTTTATTTKKVEEGMKFIDVIPREHEGEEDALSALYSHYLTEEKKTNRTILNSLVIQDHYPATADGSIPTFTIHRSSNPKNAMKEQEELLHIHKMTELARVMFTIEMMKVDSSSISLQQEFAQPNPTFVLSELQGLNSFPRKTLSSLLDEVGIAGLREWHLRMVDTMLRGVWSKFILDLFTRVKDYQPTDNVVLFLTVINGSLLLQAEDSSTLRYSLASLLVAAKKFESIFRQNAYQMIVPMLLRVYSLHSRNKMVKDAIKFLWACFYCLGKNTFLLQAIVSVANLFSPDVSGIASKMKVNYCPLCVDWEADEQTNIVRSVVELLETLDCTYDNLPQDKLEILGACPEDTGLRDLFSTWTGCSLEQVVPFCVTVASFNPEVLRGMQVLVFLDHIMVQLIREYIKKNSFSQIAASIRSLVKGCEALKRSIKSNVISSKGVQLNSNIDDQLFESNSKTSKAYIRELFHRNRSGTSQSLQLRQRSVSELPTEAQRQNYIDGFKSRSLHYINQQIVTLSRNSLLSIASQLISHAPSDDQPISKHPFDSSSLMNICFITEKVLRLASKANQDHMLDSKGIHAVFNYLLPKVVWEGDNISAFFLLLERIFKIFKKLQSENTHTTTTVPWADLTQFVKSIQQCVSNCAVLVTDNDQVLLKIKAMIEICLSTKGSSSSSASSNKKKNVYFIQSAPPEFVESFIELCTETIVTTSQLNNSKHRVLLSGLFESALDFKHSEVNSVWEKIFLPLSLNLGLRDCSCIVDADVAFIMENISKMAEHIQVVVERVKASTVKDHIRRYFISMKIMLSAYCDYFSQEQWTTIGFSFLALTSKFDARNKMYFELCLAFLDFWETFLLPSRLPIFSTSWHVIAVIESQLSAILKNNEDRSRLNILENSIKTCNTLLSNRSLLRVSLSKQELLLCLQGELLHDASMDPNFFVRAPQTQTTSFMDLENPPNDSQQQNLWSSKNQPSLKRTNSRPPNFPAISEIGETDTTLSSPDTVGGGKDSDKQLTVNKSSVTRPTSLAFKPAAKKPESTKPSTGSPKLFKSKHNVTFVDKNSPSSKKLLNSSSIKQLKTSPLQKRTYKQASRRMVHAGKDKCESGFEADEEDASLETPRSSLSHAPGLQINDRVPPHSSVTVVGNTLVVSAEIHEQDDMSLSSNDSDNHGDDTSLSSEDNLDVVPPTIPPASKPPMKMRIQTSSSSLLSVPSTDNTSMSYHDSPSSRRRQLFKTTKNSTVEEPDEQTGQISHDYLDEVEGTESKTSPMMSTPEGLAKVSHMYDAGLKQASGLLGPPVEKWPPDGDDCSV